MPQASNDQVLVRFARLSHPVALHNCRHLIDEFPRYFRNWDIAVVPGSVSDEPVMMVARTPEGYRLTAAWFGEPLDRRDDLEAICALIAEVIRASVDDNTDYLCLHAAAVQVAGRLVVFPNRYRAGKSLLSACLAAHGMRIFTDDVLPLIGREATAMAPGILPRLRLPLPDNLDTATRDVLTRQLGVNNGRYGYLDLPACRLASYGETAAIDSFVLLDRQDCGPAALVPISRSQALRQAIWQNFGREAGPEQILLRLEQAVRRAACYRLTYSRADEAARALEAAFSDTAMAAGDQAAVADEPARTVSVTAARDIVPDGTCYRRRSALTETRLDGETYLADGNSGAIHHLDTIASAVWHLLTEPMRDIDIAGELGAAFPDIDAEQIAADVKALLIDLEARRLIDTV